ncbi:MAG: RNA polymerase sigma factor [Planctomycetota bacterium]
MPETIDDSVLVREAQKGNQSSYEELIRRYARLVWSYIYGIIQDHSWAEDLVQETFINGWQSLVNLREPDKFRNWLLVIARNQALRHINKSSRHDDVIEDIAKDENVRVEADDKSNQLHNALRQLPERYRLPLTLRYLEGLDYNKISNMLGLTDGSLRGLLNRGMKMLRQTISHRVTETKE